MKLFSELLRHKFLPEDKMKVLLRDCFDLRVVTEVLMYGVDKKLISDIIRRIFPMSHAKCTELFGIADKLS